MKPGRIFGGFQILDELGRGAMGVVFKARQLSMDRDVALKFLPKRLAQDERIVARFLREARAAGQLSHPNIVGVHDVGVIDGQYYIAMECIDGSSVQKRLDEKKIPLSESETLDVAGQVADALKCAHARGILHRDIKPDNILVDRAGRARLADLGLALVDGGKDAGMLTQDGTTLGTPHYMSPEQCGGNVVDSRSDLYSLGATMFHVASNQTPYEGTTAAAVMVKVITEPPRSLKKLRPNLSPAFIALVEKAMSRDPARRFQDAKQFAEAIHKCQTHKHAISAAPVKRTAKRASYLRLWAYGALSGVAAIVILAVMQRPKQNQPNTASLSPQRPGAVVPEQSNVDETHTIGARNGAKHADNEPALLQFQKLRKEIESSRLLNQNPEEAAVRYRDLLKKSPPASQVVRERIEDAIKHAEKLQRDVAAKWKTLRNATVDKIATGTADTYRQLFEFSQAYAGSREAAAAAVLVGEIFKTWQKNALAAKQSGNLAAARALLKDAIAAVQSKDEALALQKDLDEIERLAKPAPPEDDNKRFAEISEQAERIAREFDSLTGKRFRFSAAAEFCRDALKLFRTEAIRADLEVLADAYSQAEQLLQSIRAAVNDTNQKIAVQWFANFKVAGNLSKWDETGVTFTPEGPGGLGPQLISWKFVTGESLVQLVRDMRANVPMTAITIFELGVLAYASGVESVAAESLRRVENLDEKLKLEADLLLKLMPAEKNAGAREITPPAPEKKEVVPENREQDVKKEDAPKKSDAVVELNKLGWEALGKWSHDSKIKTAYRASNGTLRCDAQDANLQLRYALDDGASISIFVRQEKGTGYGWAADNYNATVWGDRGANSRRPTTAEPVEMREVKVMKGWHNIAINIRDNKFSITYDNNEAKSSYALRMTGDIRIVVTGEALLEAPVIRK